jgi:hypothetical protein
VIIVAVRLQTRPRQGLAWGQPPPTLTLLNARFRVQGPGSQVQVPGFRVQGTGFRVQGSGFRFQCSGFTKSDEVASSAVLSIFLYASMLGDMQLWVGSRIDIFSPRETSPEP